MIQKDRTCDYCGMPTTQVIFCPICGREGCDHCMPGGRGVICPECEEKEATEEDGLM